MKVLSRNLFLCTFANFHSLSSLWWRHLYMHACVYLSHWRLLKLHNFLISMVSVLNLWCFHLISVVSQRNKVFSRWFRNWGHYSTHFTVCTYFTELFAQESGMCHASCFATTSDLFYYAGWRLNCCEVHATLTFLSSVMLLLILDEWIYVLLGKAPFPFEISPVAKFSKGSSVSVIRWWQVQPITAVWCGIFASDVR